MDLIYELGSKQELVKDEVGSKAYNLDILMKMGLSVPQAFVVNTQTCRQYLNKMSLPENLQGELLKNILEIEKKTAKKLSGRENPLLLSVRSGSIISMPGMMDTILNLGLNDEVVQALGEKTLRPKFAYNCYQRFICMFSEIVGQIDKSHLDRQIDNYLAKKKIASTKDLAIEDMRTLCQLLKLEYKEQTQHDFPDNPIDQLNQAVRAIFRSWNNKRAVAFRNYYGISHKIGTAVVVQEMVFGNMGQNSATGVSFTRDPNSGEQLLFGEFLRNAQGEDVVDGSHKPIALAELQAESPELYQELLDVCQKLEQEFRDMQDIEFTIEDGKLFILQTRSGKRTVKAAIKIAHDFFQAGLITEEEMLLRINPKDLPQLLHPVISKASKVQKIGQGLGVSFGAAKGVIALSLDKAIEYAKTQPVIFVRPETVAEDIEGMQIASGLLTQKGGITSHAAVVARSLGKTCVCSANFKIDTENSKVIFENGFELEEGAEITIDGSSGDVMIGNIILEAPASFPEADLFLEILARHSQNRVYANADTQKDIQTALAFGADGIGLCRTEHMFLDPAKLTLFQKYILTQETTHLDELAKLLRTDFENIMLELDEKNCVIRLLDPPLHEFLPNSLQAIEQTASSLGVSEQALMKNIQNLKEHNPMLGFRGVRLGVVTPEIYQMLIETIIQATIQCNQKGIVPKLKILVPFVFDLNEFLLIKDMYQKILYEHKQSLVSQAQIGVMLETPRSCLLAHEVAVEADFLSFGSNDLTQMTLGISRDDSAKFLEKYKELGVINKDPFMELDTKAVLRLMQIAVENARGAKADISIGICGEHAFDPVSAEICLNELKLDYLSVSPYNVLTALLAEVHANIKKDL